MKPGESKADKQTIRDEADATAREVERQFDQDLGTIGPFDTADELFAELERPKLTLWQRFVAWVGRVA